MLRKFGVNNAEEEMICTKSSDNGLLALLSLSLVLNNTTTTEKNISLNLFAKIFFKKIGTPNRE